MLLLEDSPPNIYSVWVQLLVFLGLLVTAIVTFLQLRKGTARRAAAEEDSSPPSPPTPTRDEPALIMLINQNEARTRELNRELSKARQQRERDLTEIARDKAELEDLRRENERLKADLLVAHQAGDAALKKASELADRLEYLENLIHRGGGRTS